MLSSTKEDHDADDDKIMKKMVRIDFVSKSEQRKEKLKPRHGNRKPLSLNGLVQWPQGHSLDLIKLSPSAVHKKGRWEKFEKRTVFSRFWPSAGCIVGLGAGCEVSPEKIWLKLSPTSARCSHFYLSTLGHSHLHKEQEVVYIFVISKRYEFYFILE